MALTKIRGNTQILDNSITEDQLASSILAADSGLTGLGGSQLAVGAGTGLVVSGSTVGIATNSTVTFSGASWTFPAGELLITGTPSTSTSAVNKAYVDNFYSAGTGISISLGVISLQTPVAVANGGTGVSTFGGTNTLLYTTTANTLASITTGNNEVLVTDGTGAPSWGTALPSQVQDSITRTGTLVAGATGGGFTISFSASSVSGTLLVGNGGTGVATLTADQLIVGDGVNPVNTLFKARVLVGANSSSVTITGLVSGATIYRVTRNGINETDNLGDYSASATDTLTNTQDPFVINEQIYVEQIQ